MPIRVTDRWRHPPRGTPEQAKATFRRWGSFPIGDVDDAVDEMYRLGWMVDLDASLMVAHAALETGDRNRGLGFLDKNWATVDRYQDSRNRYNISGMGITDGGDLGYRWANGVDAARGHVVHHARYEIPPDDPAWEVLRPYIHLDKRYDAVPVGNRGTVKTVADMTGKWWTNRNGHTNLASRGNSIFPDLPDQDAGDGDNEQEVPMTLTFGRVPHPAYTDKQHTTAGKPAGRGWDNLGTRSPKFIALHRMWGTLRGTDSHFANNNVASLTDYGLGSANIDGAALDGAIHMYNDPRGHRSPWASGPVSDPYGDGACIVNKYGVNAVNRDGVSIETPGYDTEPLSDACWSSLVKLIGYWLDQMKIPYTTLPLNPHTGCNAIIWHHEFTRGTGKQCPFTWVRNNTGRLYKDVAAYLQPFQEGPFVEPDPEPTDGIEVGSLVATTVRLNLRATPSTAGAVLTVMDAGTEARVTDGPVSDGGYRWWQIQHTTDSGDVSGWAADASGNTPYLTVVDEPEPEESDFAAPQPIEALAEYADQDKNTVVAVVTDDGRDYTFVGDRVRATRQTPRLQGPDMSGPRVGVDIEKGETFDVRWKFTGTDGSHWYVTPWWTVVRLDDTERVED